MTRTLAPIFNRFIVLFGVFIVAGASFGQAAAPNDACWARIERRVATQEARQMDWYRAHGGRLPAPSVRTRLVRGTNSTAIVAVAGFLATPADFTDILPALRATGATVLSPLITGFGAGPDAANASRIEDWQASTREAISALRECFPKVIIVAHCLGGALALDHVLNQGGAANVERLVLMAPYVRTYYPGLNILNDIFKVHTGTIDLRILRLLLQLEPARVLPIPLPAESGMSDDDSLIPLQAVESALDLQKRFPATRLPSLLGAAAGSELLLEPKLTIPVFAAVSGADQVVDGDFALGFIANRFRSVETIRFDPRDGVSHYMHHRSQNPRFDDLLGAVIRQASIPSRD